ncbi:MAG: SulP family inorganic anion transporter [Saprospiraceae bacterium]
MNFQQQFSTYQKTFRADASGALLAAIIGLPMGLAFGVQSGLGPQAGIYTAIILAFVASLFGGTKTLISDPTGPMTVVAATVVSMGLANAGGDLQNAWPLIVGTFVLAGIFELVFGIFDLGKYVKFMPYPVLSGFMAGIGVIIISVQLFPMLGHDSPRGFLNIITTLDKPLAQLNWQALILGSLTVATIYLLPKITTKIPSILVALIAGTLASIIFGLDVPVIGAIPTELPTLHLNELFLLKSEDLSYMIRPAIMLGGLGVIDSLLTSVVADNVTKTKHNSRWTVIGQGIGNMVVGLFGGIPGAGATMGTVTNIKAGATSKLSGILKGVFLLLIVVGTSEYVQYIPMSVLAGILITIGVGIIDYKGIKMLLKVPKQDAFVWAIVLAVTLFDNLLDAVAIGFAFSAILFIGRMVQNVTETQCSKCLHSVIQDNYLPAELSDHIYVHDLEGPLFFGSTDSFKQHCEEIEDVIAMILRMKQIPFLDQSGIVTLETVIEDWHERGIQVYITDANPQVIESLKKLRIIPNVIKEQDCFDCFETCVKVIHDKIEGSKCEIEYEEALLDEEILEKRHQLVHH